MSGSCGKNNFVAMTVAIAVASVTWLSIAAQAAVFDGGEFSSSKISSHTDFGASDPEPQPSNFAFEQDRYSSAPVGKPLYILGDDNKCYYGNFAYNKYEKALIVYYKSPISNDHCIYQRNSDAKPAGYSISAKMGGVCVPTLGVGDNTATDWKLEEVGSPVAFSWCVDQTVSYGDIFKNKTPANQVADDGGTTEAGVTVTASATAAAPAKATERKIASHTNEGGGRTYEVTGAEISTENLGSSVQDSPAPWKDGMAYTTGFPSINNPHDVYHVENNQYAKTESSDQSLTHLLNDTVEDKGVGSGVGHETTTFDRAMNNDEPTDAVVDGGATPPTVRVPLAQAPMHHNLVAKSSDGYTIQLFSYHSMDEASKKIEGLKEAGVEDLWVMKADVKGATYYRVCSGHYKTGKEARSNQTKVAAKSGVKEAFIQKASTDRMPASVGGDY